MYFEREGNKIFLKQNKENHMGYITGIIAIGIFCIFLINYFKGIKFDNDILDNFIHSDFFRIIFSIIIGVFIIISILNKLFYSDYSYYINLDENNINIINGRWKFKEEYIIEFEKIKNIVIIKSNQVDYRNKTKVEIYKIDIYDNELNAYELYDSTNYEIISKIASWLQSITKKEIIEKTNIDDYEGFRKRTI
jgi:hypothetical protein